MVNIEKMRREMAELKERKGNEGVPASFEVLESFLHGDISLRNADIKLMREKPRYWELQRLIIDAITTPPSDPVEWDKERREYLKGIFQELESEDKEREAGKS